MGLRKASGKDIKAGRPKGGKGKNGKGRDDGGKGALPIDLCPIICKCCGKTGHAKKDC